MHDSLPQSVSKSEKQPAMVWKSVSSKNVSVEIQCPV